MWAHPPRPGDSARADEIPQLNCEACNKRKVRCDKQDPCSTCTATGIVCVPVHRRRLPRGRHVPSLSAENKKLRQRLTRLEGLIASRDADTDDNRRSTSTSADDSDSPPPRVASASASSRTTYPISPPPPPPVPAPAPAPAPASAPAPALPPPALQRTKPPASPRYLADGFWNDLVNKNPHLYSVLCEQAFDADRTEDNNNNPPGGVDRSKLVPQHFSNFLQQRAQGSILGLGFSHSQNPQSYIDAALALRPTPAVCQKLCEAYLHRVNPIITIFYPPVLMPFLLGSKPYLHYHDNDPVLDGIRSAVFFIAVVSLTEEQCRSMFDADRASLISTYRLACEVALDRVGLITTEDISILQSLVLYLNAVRSCDRSRTAWTLFSVATRLATALRVNIDSNHVSESFFEQQMRRRLWYSICILDVHFSFDRASEPLIDHKSTQPRLPLNINDSDFGPDCKGDVSERKGLTDMTLAVVLYRAQATGRALSFEEDGSASTPETISKTTSLRKQLVEQFEFHIENLLQYCDRSSSSYAWCTYNGALGALAAMQLSLRRPMNQNGRRSITADPDPTTVLRLAATVLERDSLKRSDPRGEPFRWFGVIQWHPLAVAIAECYACDNVALLRQVWPTVETSFDYISKVLADYRQGMLWKPLERLMLKTRARVTALLGQNEHRTFTSRSDSEVYAATTASLDPSMYGHTMSCFGQPVNPISLQHMPMPASFNFSPTPPTPLHIGAMPGQNNQGGWMMGTPDPSFWQQMTPALSDPGWDAWDEFINKLNFNADDMMLP